jgi:hypothetical protein
MIGTLVIFSAVLVGINAALSVYSPNPINIGCFIIVFCLFLFNLVTWFKF